MGWVWMQVAWATRLVCAVRIVLCCVFGMLGMGQLLGCERMDDGWRDDAQTQSGESGEPGAMVWVSL